MEKLKIFCSYAHEDHQHLDALLEHLAPLHHIGLVEPWTDRAIPAGDEWAEHISDALEAADIILLLVSSSFLASEYCYNIEMKRAIELHNEKQAATIPIIIRACDWRVAPFQALNALPKEAKAVTSWSNADEAWADVAIGVRSKAQTLRDEREAQNRSAARKAPRYRSLGLDALPRSPAGHLPLGSKDDEGEPIDTDLSDSEALLLRFLSTWPRWRFNPARIARWGAARESFEELGELGVDEIRETLDNLVDKGRVERKPSKTTKSMLYKVVDPE